MGALDTLKTKIKGLKPQKKKLSFNFIGLHYLWITGLVMLGSVLVYASGPANIAYIDALVYAAGGCTQGGLTPVDLNLLNTFQQVVLYILPMLTNPITINMFVVFLRLFWFEKRFQSVVRDARQKRTTMSKARTMSRSKSNANHDLSQLERGVNGRSITVMHGGARSRITNDGILLSPVAEKVKPADLNMNGNGHAPGPQGSNSGNASDDEDPMSPTTTHQPSAIKFASTVTRSDGMGDDALKTPANPPEPHMPLIPEGHVAILERQRGGGETLVIPGPRDAERGMAPKPKEVSSDGYHALEPTGRTNSVAEPGKPKVDEPDEEDDIVQDINAIKNILLMFRIRVPRVFRSKSQQKNHQDSDDELRKRQQQFKSRRAKTMDNIRGAFAQEKVEGMPYLSWQPTMGRNSAFPNMTEEQRDELGGIEYRSLKTLAIILMWYYWGMCAFAVIGLLPWIMREDRWGGVVDAAGQGKVWWAFFTGNSAFMDLGFSIIPDSMVSFNTAIWPLIFMSFLIIAGNTGFPILLRFIIWVMSKCVPVSSGIWEELRFLLDHPRRCFTLLFPGRATWWLLFILIVLNGIDLLLFVTLDLDSEALAGMPTGIAVLNGIFQSAATRTAGFNSVNLSLLHPGVQTYMMIMMYISIFPIAISVRRTNVYEEQSLGVYAGPNDDENNTSSDMEYVGAHLRRQLSFDLWYLFAGLFILAMTEGHRIRNKDFDLFAVLFELVSAYGTVGLSLGYTGINASLCSQFTVGGKLVVAAMLIRGRHRGLPYGLDRAIMLPSESLNAKEQADADARLQRRMSGVSNMTGLTGPGGMSIRQNRSRISFDRGSHLVANMMGPGPASAHFDPENRRRSMANLGASSSAIDMHDSPLAPRRSQTAAPAGTEPPRLRIDTSRP